MFICSYVRMYMYVYVYTYLYVYVQYMYKYVFVYVRICICIGAMVMASFSIDDPFFRYMVDQWRVVLNSDAFDYFRRILP